MIEGRIETLFDEFAVSYVRGERPDVREYLERAGPDRDDLGLLIDRFLEAVPPRESTEEEIVRLQARVESEPPLLVLRLRRRLGRDAVVDAVVSKLGLDPTKRNKVGGYYHRLEVGALNPEGVAGRVWDVLGDVLGANVRSLAGRRPEPPPAVALAYRRSGGMELYERVDVPAVRQAEEPDEIDRLFTAGD